MEKATDDREFLRSLRSAVEREIRNYVYPISATSVGLPWSEDQVADGIEKMTKALVDPYWAEVEVRETIEQIERASASRRRCAVVADDCCGTLLAWDSTEDEFLLAMRVEESLHSIGVRGDAVGCFLAI